jgi:hypothetical protein
MERGPARAAACNEICWQSRETFGSTGLRARALDRIGFSSGSIQWRWRFC